MPGLGVNTCFTRLPLIPVSYSRSPKILICHLVKALGILILRMHFV